MTLSLKYGPVAAVAVAVLLMATLLWSGPLQASEDSPPPPAPSNLSLADTPGSLQVTASWDAVTGATSYEVSWRERSAEFQSGDETVVQDDTTATITVSAVGEWVVRVEACNDAGCSKGATHRGVVGIPASPDGLTLASGENLSITASWSELHLADSYQVSWRERSAEFQSGDETVVEGDETATLTVSADGEWVVRVAGCNDAGCGKGATASVVLGELAAPSNLTLTPGDGFNMTASWNEVAGVGVYKVRWRQRDAEFRENDSMLFLPLDSGPGVTVSFTVSDFGEWIVRVEACKNSVCSKGATAMATTTVSKPTTPITPVCERTVGVRDALIEATGKACNAITDVDLAIVTSVSDFTGISSFSEGDFSGLQSLQTLNLSRNTDLTSLPEDIFDGLSSLQTLALSFNTGLTSLPDDIFDGLSSLQNLGMSFNTGLTSLPDGVFHGLSSLQTLQLMVNPNLTVPDGCSTARPLEHKDGCSWFAASGT